MSKKVDYSLKFYKGRMINENQEVYNFYLAERTDDYAYNRIEDYVTSHSDRYHIIPGKNEIESITVTEVSVEDYGKCYGYEIIN